MHTIKEFEGKIARNNKARRRRFRTPIEQHHIGKIEKRIIRHLVQAMNSFGQFGESFIDLGHSARKASEAAEKLRSAMMKQERIHSGVQMMRSGTVQIQPQHPFAKFIGKPTFKK